MTKLDLQSVQRWIGNDLIVKIKTARIQNGEIQRQRKLGTTELLWMFLQVALYSTTMNLHEIIKWAIADLNSEHKWSVSVAAFCKARIIFSPTAFVCHLGAPCQKNET